MARLTGSASSLRDVALVATACALIAGAIEAGIAAFKQVVLGQLVFLSHDYAWMIPASFLLLLVPATLIVAAFFKAIKRPLALSTILGLLTALLIFVMLIPYGVIAWWASAPLAAGIGLQLSRRAGAASHERWIPPLRRVTAVVAAIVVIAGVTVRAERAWSRRQAAAKLTNAGGAAPNVLLIVLDTVRASSMGLYGHRRPTTPELTKWASESAVFDNAISTAPWTLPSHGSLFTGRAAGALGVDWLTPLSETPRTLAEELESRGYATGGFVANLPYTSAESGLARGFSHYDDYRVSLPLVLTHSTLGRIGIRTRLPQARSVLQAARALVRSSFWARNAGRGGYRSADKVTAAFLAWQQQVTDRPFFAFLNLFDAHGPYRVPASPRPSFDYNRLSERDRYDAAIAWLDRQLGMMLTTLQERGVLDRTIVIITSDHGEQFGEHGLSGHGNSLYLDALRVPLLVRYPAAVPPGRVGTLVSLKDVPATILELAGVPGGHEIQGTSLSKTWKQPGQPALGDVVAELGKGINEGPLARNYGGKVVSRLDGRFHYIRNGGGSEELYDYVADPRELVDRASDPAVQDVLLRMRASLPGR